MDTSGMLDVIKRLPGETMISRAIASLQND